MTWTPGKPGTLRGKTFVVTGSNSGIGYATAQALAAKDARVVLACRNLDKGAAAVARIKQEIPAADLRLLPLDLASLASVRQFASQLPTEIGQLDGLVNNAGLMMPPLQHTADGFELQFGTNVLGHFALTGLLLPLLDKASSARVIWLGSIAHWRGRIDFDNLNSEKRYGRWTAYAQSKLADIMLAYELERRLRSAGSSVVSLAAHPGGTKSDLQRNNALLKMAAVIGAALTQSASDGALPSLRALLDPAAQGGEYYGPSRLFTFQGPPTRQRSSRRSHDEAIAARLWQACEQLTGVRYP